MLGTASNRGTLPRLEAAAGESDENNKERTKFSAETKGKNEKVHHSEASRAYRSSIITLTHQVLTL